MRPGRRRRPGRSPAGSAAGGAWRRGAGGRMAWDRRGGCSGGLAATARTRLRVRAGPGAVATGAAAARGVGRQRGRLAAAWVGRLLGTGRAGVSRWEVAAAVSDGRLLAVSPPARLFSTSGHLEPAM